MYRERQPDCARRQVFARPQRTLQMLKEERIVSEKHGGGLRVSVCHSCLLLLLCCLLLVAAATALIISALRKCWSSTICSGRNNGSAQLVSCSNFGCFQPPSKNLMQFFTCGSICIRLVCIWSRGATTKHKHILYIWCFSISDVYY